MIWSLLDSFLFIFWKALCHGRAFKAKIKMTSMTELKTKKYRQLSNHLQEVSLMNSTHIYNIVEISNSKRDLTIIIWEKYSKTLCTKEGMIMITNTIGFWKKRGKKFQIMIMLILSQQLEMLQLLKEKKFQQTMEIN